MRWGLNLQIHVGGGRKTSPRTSTIVQFIFHFWSFEVSEHILRNQNLIIGLDSYSRQRFIYLDPILIYISLSIDCLFEITNLQHVPSDFHCKVITGSLMRLFLAETSKYGPSSSLRMCSLLLKERTFVFLFTCKCIQVIVRIYSENIPRKIIHLKRVCWRGKECAFTNKCYTEQLKNPHFQEQ